MATTVQTFFISPTEQDFTAPSEVDIRKLEVSLNADNTLSSCQFGTSVGEVVVDPYNANSTVAVANAPNYGWAINKNGSDGMESVATGKRKIEAGSWTFNGHLVTLLAVTGTYRMRVRAYRVDSSGNRSLLFGPLNSATVSPTPAGTDVSITSSQSKILFEDDETLLISYAIEKTNTTVATESIQLRGNPAIGNNTEVIVPSPGIRTDYFRSFGTVVMKGIASFERSLALKRSFDVVMTGIADLSRALTLKRTLTVTMAGIATLNRRLNFRRVFEATMIGRATIIKKIFLTFNATMVGIATIQKKIILTFNATMTGVASLSRQLNLYRNFATTMAGVATFSRKFIGRRVLTATMTGRASALIKMSFDISKRIASGGGTTINKVINYLFDD